MSVASMLRHRVNVVRWVDSGSEDSLGQPVLNSTAVASGIPAYVQEHTGRDVPAPAPSQGITTIVATVYLLPTADVHEADRITRVDNGREYRVRYVRDPAGRGALLAADCIMADWVDDSPVPA